MKKHVLTILALITIVFASAQVPQALNYQAVARNSMGQVVSSQNIGVRFTILVSNTILYSETHSTTTNMFGLFTLTIGKGSPVTGTFAGIDWSAAGDKYLKVEIAPQGGNNYTIQGMTQFLSMPYALYAEKTKLTGGNAIIITNGNTINANYIAGPGIKINGNTISASDSFWVADINGIRNNNASGHVGIGGSSNNAHSLTVSMMENTLDGRAIAKLVSNDIWQSSFRIDNTTSNRGFSLIVGGTGNTFTNYGVGPANFGVANGPISNTTSTIPLIITYDNKVGISDRNGGSDNLPKSRLHVRDGDIYIDQVGSGVIMKSPNGQCWRMTVSNAGAPVFTAIACP